MEERNMMSLIVGRAVLGAFCEAPVTLRKLRLWLERYAIRKEEKAEERATGVAVVYQHVTVDLLSSTETLDRISAMPDFDRALRMAEEAKRLGQLDEEGRLYRLVVTEPPEEGNTP